MAVHTDGVYCVSQCVYHCVHTDRVYCVSQCVYNCFHCLCSDGGSESVEEDDEEETPALPTASGNPWLTHKGVSGWVGLVPRPSPISGGGSGVLNDTFCHWTRPYFSKECHNCIYKSKT